MKGYIYRGPGLITLEEINLPTCTDNDIIVKNLAAGICGSDVTAYRHDGDNVYIFKGSEFGHEMVSEVVEVGANVQGIRVGDRVYPYPITCKDDWTRAATVGGFSEYVHIPNCMLDWSVFKVDDAISDHAAAMIEPFTVGGHAAKIAEPGPGKNAIVFGAGIIGMSAAITLKYLGCEKVMVVNRTTYRLEKAKALGFATCSLLSENLGEKADAYLGTLQPGFGGGLNADIYVDATGSADAIDYFIKYAKSGAVLSVVGVHHEPRSIDLIPLTYRGLSIKGSPGYDMQDVARAMEIMKSGQFDVESLISHVYPHDQLEEAIQVAATTSISEKVLIQY